MEISEVSINTFFDLLFRRLDNTQPEIAKFRNEFDLKFQSLKKCYQSSAEICDSNRKDFLEKFRQLLQYSSPDDPQSLYLNFVKELDIFINNIKSCNQYDHIPINNTIIDDGMNTGFSSNKNTLLLRLSKESVKIQKELILRKTKSQILYNMTSVYKKDSCLYQLNDFIVKEIGGQAPINNNIRSAMKMANDVQSVIDMMNQSIKDS